MFQITQYESTKQPKVQKLTKLESVLKTIKEGDDNLSIIQMARTLGKENPKYTTIKTTLLPTFRFNFLFNGSASNNNITAPTGLIYLDADNVQDIPDSPYVLAKWKSLSNTGFGILVQVDGLTMHNYRDTYNQLSELIGFTSDAGARKATQQTIQSYDPNLYYNIDSLVYQCTESKKVSFPTIEKKEKSIGTNDTFSNKDEDTIRFNNINDYFTNEYIDYEYRIFNIKEKICNPFIPFRIEVGSRNNTMFFLLSQYALLNPKAGGGWLKAISDTINMKMYPNLSDKETNLIIDSILKKREAGSLQPYFNEERRVLFNPKVSLSTKEKMKIVNTELGKRKSDLTKDIIYLVLENWDFETDGKITQQKVVKYANRNVSTIKRHWSDFKSYVKDLNSSYCKPIINIPNEAAEKEAILTFKLDDQVSLYDVLPAMSFTVEESMHIIYDLDSSNIMMWEFVQYIGKQRKEQQYNDYQGVPITPERIGALMAIITA